MQISDRQHHVRSLLDRLSAQPPQVLLLEGGEAHDRLALAEHWAARLNCATREACGGCRPCTQVRDRVHPDLIVFDGTEGKIKIEPVRELKPTLGQPPRGDGKRVVVFHEAQELTQQAANALLKSLEEPSHGTVFVLLSPMREWLLPTLVSRSWTLTLAWPQGPAPDEDIADWLITLLDFWRSGHGWFKRTSTKGAVDKDLAMRLVLALQREVARTLSGQQDTTVSQSFAKLPLNRLKTVELTLAHAQDALSLPTSPVNPTTTLDWLATRIYRAVRGR